jgi:hypothetical protein
MPAMVTIKLLGMAGAASYALARLSVWSGLFSWQRAHIGYVPRSQLSPMPAGFAVRALSLEDLTHHRIDIGAVEQAQRFAQGYVCLGCFNTRGVLVGVVWMARGSATVSEFPLRFILPPNMAWDNGMWIPERYRLGRAFAALWAGIGEWLDAEGCTASYSFIAEYNLRSLAAHRRLGFTETQMITWLRLGGRGWLKASGQRWMGMRSDERRDWPLK